MFNDVAKMNTPISIKAKLSQEDTLRILLALAWSRNMISLYIRVFISKLLFNNDALASILMGIVIVALIIFTFPYVRKEIRYTDFGLYFLFVAIYCISMIKPDRAGVYLSGQAVTILLTYVPLFFVGIVLNEKRIDFLHNVSIVSLFCYLLYITIFGNTVEAGSENMSDAYLILPHVCLMIFYYANKKRKLDLVLSILGSLLLIFYGTRGPVLCLSIFVFIIIMFYMRRGINRFFVIALGTIIAFLIYFYNTSVLLFLISISSKIGLSTRVFDSIMNNVFFSTETRDPIIKAVLNGIKEKPLLGYGLAGDRLLVNVYSHNIVLEFIVSFGIIIGSVLLMILVYFIINGLRKSNSANERFLLLLLICTNGILKLMMSGTYLREPYFFLLIGLCVGINRRFRNTRSLAHY